MTTAMLRSMSYLDKAIGNKRLASWFVPERVCCSVLFVDVVAVIITVVVVVAVYKIHVSRSHWQQGQDRPGRVFRGHALPRTGSITWELVRNPESQSTTSDLLSHTWHFNKILRWYTCTLKFKKHRSRGGNRTCTNWRGRERWREDPSQSWKSKSHISRRVRVMLAGKAGGWAMINIFPLHQLYPDR